MGKDTFEFLTIDRASDEILHKEKGSKFFGYAFPILSEVDVKKNIDLLKEKHKSAGHFCFAYRLGANGDIHKVSDDGEPNNSAGMPILGQLKAKNITNTLVVIVRYFGGTKLGVGGLISAYRTSSKQSLNTCKITTQHLKEIMSVHFTYNDLSHVMRIVKKYNLEILEQHQELECWLKILVKNRDLEIVKSAFKSLHKIKLEIFND